MRQRNFLAGRFCSTFVDTKVVEEDPGTTEERVESLAPLGSTYPDHCRRDER
ncbi:MAG TPA: hypothetical protein VJ964_01055 [Balneolaceae bacterium]|nr:hypothetical protein [Balneolaceae bacterium]